MKILTIKIKKPAWYILGLCALFATYSEADNNTKTLHAYEQELCYWRDHKFNANQIRSFVYYWFALHDKHVNINNSYALLSNTGLKMVFPEITVHNLSDYKKWYDGVGQNIVNNIHHVRSLQVTLLPNHSYEVNLRVNWQAIDKSDKFINIEATQKWLLEDGKSNVHPYIKQYLVTSFQPVIAKLK